MNAVLWKKRLIHCGFALVLCAGIVPQASAHISFGYGFPGFSIGYGPHGHFRGGHFGRWQPYIGPRFYRQPGYFAPHFRGGFRSYSHRPYRHYRPRRFYRPHRFHRFRRY